MPDIPRALTVGGSDSSGGAGVQADLKTFMAHRVHGFCAITGVTAQNSLGVSRAAVLEADFVAAQIEAVASDSRMDAGKTGLLFNAAIVEAVADALTRHRLPCLVVDPVLVDKHDRPILEAGAIRQAQEKLIPLCALLTPNLREAELLSGRQLSNLDSVQEAARDIHGQGAASVLIKGGRWADRPGTDIFFDGTRCEILPPVVSGLPKPYGTGCTLSAAIAANLALGMVTFAAIEKAREYLGEALRRSVRIGRGQPVLGH